MSDGRGNDRADKSRVNSALAGRVLDGVTERLIKNRSIAIPSGLIDTTTSTTKRRRCELLDLSTETDSARWQIIHNDVDRYEVISEKYSMIRADDFVDYKCLIVYNEIGDSLPLVRTGKDLRKDDEARIKEISGESND